MMRFKDKRSKITGMDVRSRSGGGQAGVETGQEGMASIVVVSVLIIILTLISLGFSRLINRAATDSANRQFSAEATYAAQSAINDVAAYLKKYAQANPGSSFLPKATKCSGPGSLVGTSGAQGPFYNATDLSGNSSARYTCLLLDPTPNNLEYRQVLNLKSQVVKVNTSAAAGALDKLMISWQPSCDITNNPNCPNGYPLSSNILSDQTTWNSTTPNCKNSGANAPCIPMLRVTIIPVASGSALSSVQSKTVFLYPQGPSGTVMVKPYTDNVNFKDGSIIAVPCTQTIAANTFTPATADYKCNIIISSLAGAIAPALTDSVYLRLTPIYNQADIKIAANDKFGDSLVFISDQAVVDATAQAGGVSKRLQARVNTSSLAANSSGIDTNISSGSDSIPEQSVRSANAICKREVQTTSLTGGFANFIGFDDPDNVCHDVGGVPPPTGNPVPTLTFSIKGNNGTDNGRTVDSEANNPGSPQNPVQKGTVYINDSVTLNWNTIDATSCTASGGSPGWASPPDKNGLMTFSGSPAINGAGSQTFGGISNITEYDLFCSRPFSPGPSATKKVFAWPPPRITNLSVNPTSFEAGSDYTVSWNSVNTSPDSYNPCTLSGNWNSPGATAHTGSQTMNWPLLDGSSTRSFTVTCNDPIGRTDSSTITVNRSGNICTGNGCTGGGGGGTVTAPSCSAPMAQVHDNGNGTGWWQFQGSCPSASPYDGGYHVNSNIPSLGSGDVPAFEAVPGWMGAPLGAGTWCIQLIEWVPGWTSVGSPSGDTGYNCVTIYPPVSLDIGSASGIWDQGPECSYPNPVSTYHWADRTWWCRNGRFPVFPGDTRPGCADGVHRWTTCDIFWSANGGSGNLSCTLSTSYGGLDSGGAGFHNVPATTRSGGIGWGDSGSPNPFVLSCTDNVTGWIYSHLENIP
jgi:hypothetical protein